MRTLVASVLVLVLAGCAAAQSAPTSSPTPTVGRATPSPTSSPSPPGTVAPTAEPFLYAGFDTAKVGQANGIFLATTLAASGPGDVEQWTLTVDKVMFAPTYPGTGGQPRDVPSVRGDVFVAYHVTYHALATTTPYGPADWGLWIGYRSFRKTAAVRNGPLPLLDSGSLSAGGSVSGWIVQEVPATGQLTIAYSPAVMLGFGFEVQARSK